MESNKHGEHSRRAILYRGEITGPVLETDIMSPFFNYGKGFFETILFENGKLWFYQEHINRIIKTSSDFDINLDKHQFSEKLIYKYLKYSNLDNHCCRVKIIYAPIKDGSRWDTIITATPYTRSAGDYSLSIHNEIYDSRLNLYKSLNYEYNLYWKKHYMNQDHSDEVLFCNKEGNILEGSYTNILFREGDTLFHVDKCCNYLHGIMQDQILNETGKIGKYTIQPLKKGIDPERIIEADEVIICNSLILAQNVIKIIYSNKEYTWDSSPGSNYLATEIRGKLITKHL